MLRDKKVVGVFVRFFVASKLLTMLLNLHAFSQAIAAAAFEGLTVCH
jgi:hypothetical protein